MIRVMMPRDLVTNPVPVPRRLRFSVDDYYKMIEMGMIEDYEKSEIIDGEMVPKMTIGDRHAWVVDALFKYFIKNLPDNILVRGQNPLRLSDFDEPEPDLVLADLTKIVGKRHPRANEVLLIVEVADASLRYDRDKKLPIYAEAEIPEVWIVNLPKNVVEVHNDPAVGIYQHAKIFKLEDIVESSVLPEFKLRASEILS